MMEKVVHKTSWYAFVLQETYHTRLSSITRDDICACTLLADHQKSTYQQSKSLSSISIDNHRRTQQRSRIRTCRVLLRSFGLYAV
jgi:hypothetical protein